MAVSFIDVNVLPRLLKLTRKKLALKVASLTTMCSARLGRDWHCLRLNEVIICQKHVVLSIHITYHPQYDQTLELTTLVLIGTSNLCNQCLSVVSSNPVHGELCSTQHYVIKFVSDLRQVGGFLWVLRCPPPIKLIATCTI
jgi:hypothetical protein